MNLEYFIPQGINELNLVRLKELNNMHEHHTMHDDDDTMIMSMDQHHHDHDTSSTNNVLSYGSTPSSSFCQCMSMSDSNGGMTMYMDGFKLSFLNPESTCLNLYSSSFTLNTKSKFIIAMIIIMCVGISVEGISYFKSRYIFNAQKKVHKLKEKKEDCCQGSDQDTSREIIVQRTKIILTIFQAIQVLIGYMLMLSAMTYSIELLSSAVIGLSMGYYMFGKYEPSLKFILMDHDCENVVDERHLQDNSNNHCCGMSDESDLMLRFDDSTINHAQNNNFDYHQVDETINHDDEEESSLFLRVGKKKNTTTI
mmetsp:Transcript_27336/g.31855  ORF Transcript_27336/g.31855 Transcript_27336/m.31855 type:complete len:310 (-) Transcript_27336:1094-2023(-)